VCHEGSIPYHRLVAEIFVHAALLARRSGIDLGAPFRKRLERMIEFTAGYTKPGGEAPVWGDADDGRVHNLGAQPMNDHRYLLHLSGALHGRSDLAERGGALPLDAAALLDDSLQDAFDRLPRTSVAVGSEGFPQGGFFVLRAQKGYALIDCGDVGMRGRGGHGHHDTLAVELSLGGVDVLADTGCSSYTRDRNERWASISVRAHNVASVDGREPARFADDRLTQAGAYRWEVRAWRPEALQFVGAHHGYGEQATYERAVSLDASGNACEFVDRFSGSGKHAASWMFHFAEPWSEPKVEAGRAVLERGDSVLELIWDHPEAKMTALRTPIYPTYGNRRERWALRFDAAFSGSITVRFNFRLQKQVQHS